MHYVTRVLLITGFLLITGLTLAIADPSVDGSAPIAAKDAQADFDALYEGLKASHVDLYAHRSKKDFDTRFAQIKKRFNQPIERWELTLEFQRFVAYGNVAHANIAFATDVYSNYRESGGLAFPIYPRIVDGRTYIGEDYSGIDAIQPGDEILAINDVSMVEWLERTSAHISADTPYIAHSLLEFWFPVYLWVELGEQPSYTLSVMSRGDKRHDVRVPGLTRADIAAAGDSSNDAFSLDASSRSYRMLTDKIAYLRSGPFYNVEDAENLWDNNAYATFVDAAFEDFIKNDATALVIDLRNNPGGDNSFSDHLLAWVADKPFRFASQFLIRSSDAAAASNQARIDAQPDAAASTSAQLAAFYEKTERGQIAEFDLPYSQPRDGVRFEGDVYVLVDRHSYSNAVNVAAMVQDYRWGVVAGEKTTDMATTFGAMEHFTLPKTGIRVGFPKAHIIRPSGRTDTHGVTPDVLIATPIVAGANDAVLDQLIAIIQQR
ncbi:MAG: S41 family peptidase [Pseudomonadota bacterium]